MLTRWLRNWVDVGTLVILAGTHHCPGWVWLGAIENLLFGSVQDRSSFLQGTTLANDEIIDTRIFYLSLTNRKVNLNVHLNRNPAGLCIENTYIPGGATICSEKSMLSPILRQSLHNQYLCAEFHSFTILYFCTLSLHTHSTILNFGCPSLTADFYIGFHFTLHSWF